MAASLRREGLGLVLAVELRVERVRVVRAVVVEWNAVLVDEAEAEVAQGAAVESVEKAVAKLVREAVVVRVEVVELVERVEQKVERVVEGVEVDGGSEHERLDEAGDVVENRATIDEMIKWKCSSKSRPSRAGIEKIPETELTLTIESRDEAKVEEDRAHRVEVELRVVADLPEVAIAKETKEIEGIDKPNDPDLLFTDQIRHVILPLFFTYFFL